MGYGSVENQASYVSKYGDTMEGPLDMNGFPITGLPDIDLNDSWVELGSASYSYSTQENIYFQSRADIQIEHPFSYYNKLYLSFTGNASGVQTRVITVTISLTSYQATTPGSAMESQISLNRSTIPGVRGYFIPFMNLGTSTLVFTNFGEYLNTTGITNNGISIWISGTPRYGGFSGEVTYTLYGQVLK